MAKGHGSSSGGKGGGGGGGGGSNKGAAGSGTAPTQTQAQINRARECNPNSPSFWQSRGLPVPESNRGDAAAKLQK